MLNFLFYVLLSIVYLLSFLLLYKVFVRILSGESSRIIDIIFVFQHVIVLIFIQTYC